jgi:hypothetical protein
MCLSGVLVPHRLIRDRPRRARFLGVRVECGSDVAASTTRCPPGLHLLPSTPRSNCGGGRGVLMLSPPEIGSFPDSRGNRELPP